MNFLIRLLGNASLTLLCSASSASAQAPAPPEPIECGALVDSGLMAPGTERSYWFHGDPGDTIFFRHLESPGVSMVILGPQGQPRGISYDMFTPDLSGPYTVTLRNNGSTPKRGRLQLDWLAPSSKQCGDRVQCGSSVLGAAASPFPKTYHFEAEHGDVVLLSIAGVTYTGGFDVQVYRPDGTSLRSHFPHGVIPLDSPLDSTGSYTILVDRKTGFIHDDYGTFRVDLNWMAPASKRCGQDLQCDAVVSGDIASSDEDDLYFVTGRGGDVFHIESVGDDGGAPHVEIWDEHGNSYLPSGYYQTFELPASGTYALRAMNYFGKYRMRVRKVVPGDEACAPILQCGVPVHGATLWGTGAEFYAFDVDPGDQVRLDVTSDAGRDPAWAEGHHWSAQWLVFAPGFVPIPFDFSRANTLAQPGRYFLKVIDGGGGQYAPGSYTIKATWELPVSRRCDQVCPPGVPGACTGLSVRAVDFNDATFRAAPSDPTVLQAGGREVEGAAADGVTPVLLVVEGLTGPGSVTFSALDECSSLQSAAVGSLYDPITGHTGMPLTVQATQTPGRSWKAFAVWTTPLDFSRGDRDDGAAYRTVSCDVTASGTCGRKSLLLVRPPVLLVHGLWGSGQSWDFRSLPGRNAARYKIGGRTMPEYVYRHDYRLTNADHFLSNVSPLRRDIEGTLRTFRGLDAATDVPLACTQVDLIGHSMGCLVSRLFIAGVTGDYERSENFLRGDAHKFITIAGPHYGSPLADLAESLFSIPALGDVIAGVARELGSCLDCGAVEDLQLDSLNAIPPALVPCHAIYGTGASDYIGSGGIVPPRVFRDAVTGLVSAISAFKKDTLLDFSVLLFGDEANDMVVGKPSGRSGLPDSKVTSFGFVDGLHTYMHKSWRVEARVFELLNARILDSRGPFSAVLPGGPDSLAVSASSPGAGGTGMHGFDSFGILEGSLRLTSPMALTGLSPGDAISVEVFPVTGFVPEAVIVLGGAGGVEVLREAPFRTVVEIPSVADVSHALIAIGWSGNSFAISGQLLLSLDGSAVPQSLIVSPNPLFLLPYEPCVQLSVDARYADLSLRQVQPDDPGLSFQSSDSAVATVDSEGHVCAQANGRATISVTYDGRSIEVPVVVDLTPTDHH